MIAAALTLGVVLAGAPEPLIDVQSAVPDAIVDLKYATTDNFMKKQVYPSGARCLLLAEAVERLQAAAAALRAQGYRLRLFDCYRPHHLQVELWKVMPVKGYVADPKTGSRHSRGAAVDLALATLDGHELDFPSQYDFFGPAAHHSFSGGSPQATAHRAALRQAMEAAGFNRNPKEWWHYELPRITGYPLRDEPITPISFPSRKPSEAAPSSKSRPR